MTNPHAYLQDAGQIAGVETLGRLDAEGYLYHMVCDYDYYALPDQLMGMLDAGCSTFFAPNLAGEHVMYRNYDYSHFLHNDRHNPRTAVNVVVEAHNPAAKYQSLGVCDAFWLDYQNGNYVNGCLDDGTTDVSPLVLAPYVCMDGVNECGLAVSVMALSVEAEWEEIPYEGYEAHLQYGIDPLVLEAPGEVPPRDYIYARQDGLALNHADKKAWLAHVEHFMTTVPGRRTVLPPVMMRLMLDNCANVAEAVALAGTLNIAAPMPGSGYHIMVADASGEARLLEWVDNEMRVVETSHATNYYRSREDGFHGVCRRDECIKAALTRFAKGMREDYGVALLNLIAQDSTNGADRGKTLYSCVYNTAKRSLEVYSFGDFSRSWTFAP